MTSDLSPPKKIKGILNNKPTHVLLKKKKGKKSCQTSCYYIKQSSLRYSWNPETLLRGYKNFSVRAE